MTDSNKEAKIIMTGIGFHCRQSQFLLMCLVIFIFGLILPAMAQGAESEQKNSEPEEGSTPPSGIPKDFRDLGDILMYSTFLVTGVYRNNPLTSETEEASGSCFLVGIPDPKDKAKVHVALVTAKHVLDDILADTATIHFRRRDAAGHWQKWEATVKIKDGLNKPLYLRHPYADVAAFNLLESMNVADRLELKRISEVGDIVIAPIGFLATDEQLKNASIRPGFELFCLGFPRKFETQQGFPIERMGCIASWPILPSREYGEFLFDFPVISGNSGGPVYLRSDWKGELIIRQHIVGLISDMRKKNGVDMQVSGVVPACFISDLLRIGDKNSAQVEQTPAFPKIVLPSLENQNHWKNNLFWK